MNHSPSNDRRTHRTPAKPSTASAHRRGLGDLRREHPLAFAGGVAALTGAAVLSLRRSRRGAARPGPPQQAVVRNARVVQQSARIGTAWASHRAARVFASTERRIELDEAYRLRTYDQVAAALGGLKGGMMKLGQMVSHVDPDLPPLFRESLARLQQSAPPMAAELASTVVAEELGAPPAEVFAVWDPEPFAAASIGQVHRALTTDGRAVAVKVQYPGIDEAIRSDMRSASAIFLLLRPLFPGLDADALIDEITDRLVEEVDYSLEADHQEEFGAAYAGHPHIHIPWVDRSLSTSRVLTTELVAGASITEARTWPAHERDLLGETIYRFVFGSLYRHRMFNGDPHPGNYRFHRGGRVTFLDFGLVKHLDPEDFERYQRLSRAATSEADATALRAALIETGFLAPDSTLSDDQVDTFFGRFYDFIRKDERVTMTPESASRLVRSYFDVAGPDGEVVRATNVPPGFAILQRINLGLHGVLAELGATANWHRLAEELWPWAQRAPETELGLADAAWRQRQGASVRASAPTAAAASSSLPRNASRSARRAR